MRTATLSILGMYNYNPGIFDLFSLPDGINKDDIITNICGELAELELLYPNYEVLRALIGVWSRTSLYKWEKLYKTMLLEYNPIDNYDRTETRTLNSKGTGTGKDSGSDTMTGNSTAGGKDTLKITGTDTEKIAGFNSSPNTLVDKSSITKNDTNETTFGKTVNGSQTTNYGKQRTDTFNRDDTETIHARGNIGVTTTQQMMEQERNIADFNLYGIITEDFKQRFCLLVY